MGEGLSLLHKLFLKKDDERTTVGLANKLANDPSMIRIKAENQARIDAAELKKQQHEQLIKQTEQRVATVYKMVQRLLSEAKSTSLNHDLLENGQKVHFRIEQEQMTRGTFRLYKETQDGSKLDLALNMQDEKPTLQVRDYQNNIWRKSTSGSGIFSGEQLLELIPELDAAEEVLSSFQDFSTELSDAVEPFVVGTNNE